MALKLEFTGHDCRCGLDEGQLQVFRERRWQWPAIVFLQGRLRIEQFILAGAAFHEHENHMPGSGCEVRHSRREFASGKLLAAVSPSAVSKSPSAAMPTNRFRLNF